MTTVDIQAVSGDDNGARGRAADVAARTDATHPVARRQVDATTEASTSRDGDASGSEREERAVPTPYGIDPDEWAEAARDATLTGGGSEAEAVAAADQARAYVTDPARAEDDRFVLHNTTEDMAAWERELAAGLADTDACDDTDGM